MNYITNTLELWNNIIFYILIIIIINIININIYIYYIENILI